MKNKRRWIAIIVSIVLIIGAISFYYGYLYKDGRNISVEKSEFTVDAAHVAKEYADNVNNANAKYLNKTIEVKGFVTRVSDSVITLDSVVFCGFDNEIKYNTLNSSVTVKGRCIGYDELFNEVKLDQCTIKE